MPVPEGSRITAVGGKFAHDPFTMIAESGAVSCQNGSGVPPVEIVNEGRQESEAGECGRKGRG
jgi:hypothetical protein